MAVFQLLKVTAMLGLLLLPPASMTGSTQQKNEYDPLYAILDDTHYFAFSGDRKQEFFTCTTSSSPGQTCRVEYLCDEGCSRTLGKCCFNVTNIQSAPQSDSQFKDVLECQPPQFPTNFTLNCEQQTVRKAPFLSGSFRHFRGTYCQSCKLTCRNYKVMYARQRSQIPSVEETCELQKSTSRPTTTAPPLDVTTQGNPGQIVQGLARLSLTPTNNRGFYHRNNKKHRNFNFGRNLLNGLFNRGRGK